MMDHAIGATSPPAGRGRPWVAGLLGLCLGPVGTAWTLSSRHALLTGTVYVVASIHWGGLGMVYGLIVAGLYGAVVVASRNARHDAERRAQERAEARARTEALCKPWLRHGSAPGGRDLEAVAVPAAETEEAPAEPLPSPVLVDEPRLVAEPESSVPEVVTEPPTPVELPPVVVEVEPPSPPVPPAPRKRGRPKGSRKLAA